MSSIKDKTLYIVCMKGGKCITATGSNLKAALRDGAPIVSWEEVVN